MGTCDVMRQNPWNAVMNLGHSNGVVSMWTPNMSTPVVKMLCHKVTLGSLPQAMHPLRSSALHSVQAPADAHCGGLSALLCQSRCRSRLPSCLADII